MIAQKKRPDALNTTQKIPALYNVPFLNKSRKTFEKIAFLKKMGIFLQFFFIYSGTVHGRELRSFALYSVHQDASFELSKTVFGEKNQFFTIRGDPCDLVRPKN